MLAGRRCSRKFRLLCCTFDQFERFLPDRIILPDRKENPPFSKHVKVTVGYMNLIMTLHPIVQALKRGDQMFMMCRVLKLAKIHKEINVNARQSKSNY